MGLDISHGCWHGAYSAFSRWRDKIAEAAGYLVRPVQWTDDKHSFVNGRAYILLDWGAVTPAMNLGQWAADDPLLVYDPLTVLLVHADDEGVIFPTQAGPLADELEALLPKLDGDGGGHVGNYRETTQKFIDGLRLAASKGETIEFH